MNQKLWNKIKQKQRLWVRLDVMRKDNRHMDREYRKALLKYKRMSNHVRKEARKEEKEYGKKYSMQC